MVMSNKHSLTLALGLVLAGCDPAGGPQTGVDSTSRAIVDVSHSAVERQSIGNCWIYAEASWVEAMALAANPGKELDVSQSYWTYWHWFDQLNGFPPGEIETGGFQFTAHQIVLDRGVMFEGEFVPEDGDDEMSFRQDEALSTINDALSSGEIDGSDGKKIRDLLDDAWQLSPEVRAQLDKAFGEDGQQTLRQGASVAGTKIVEPTDVAARFTERQQGGQTVTRDSNLADAIDQWNTINYPFNAAQRRQFLQRVQRALHDRQPVIITWDVDFNALENAEGPLRGSFNMQTLTASGGPGHQGGHMTILEDYEAETTQFGTLKAAVTLDPSKAADAQKLQAALADSTKIKFLRIKNSWGTKRTDRAFAPGFPGYHDLHLDYLNGPIKFCPNEENPTAENCTDETVPLGAVQLPPGY
jgi:hypothetical protein